MKFYDSAGMFQVILSLPARGAWVEISKYVSNLPKNRSLPARGAWVEIGGGGGFGSGDLCRSPRGGRGLK